MSSATWTPVSTGASATWSKNKARTDLEAAATTYNNASVTYNSATTYYNGYNPGTTTVEGEAGATWQKVSE